LLFAPAEVRLERRPDCSFLFNAAGGSAIPRRQTNASLGAPGAEGHVVICNSAGPRTGVTDRQTVQLIERRRF